jgi:UDP-N-acetylglucosamine acyltransferase
MVVADVKAVKDVPPFTLVGREPAKVEGVNKVGLKRRGFSNETIRAIDDFYVTLLHSGMNNSDAIAKVLEQGEPIAEVRRCIDYIQNSNRGIYR